MRNWSSQATTSLMSPNGPVVREDPVHRAGVDHPRDRVVPQVLLEDGTLGVDGVLDAGRRVLADEVPRVAAADAGRLHPAVGREVGRPEADALHPRARAADLLDVRDAASGLEDGVDEDRPGQPGLRLELGEEAVDVVDVLRALDLGDHDDVESVADGGDEGRQVVEGPWAVEGVDPGPQLGVLAEVGRPGDVDEPLAGGLLVLGLDGVLEVAEEDVDGADEVGDLGRHLGVARVEEMDHPAGPRRHLPDRRGRPDGEGAEEVLGAAHEGLPCARETGRGRSVEGGPGRPRPLGTTLAARGQGRR